MALIVCPKCGSETDASKPTCMFCGKVIIGLSKPKPKSDEPETSLGSYFDTEIDESFLDESSSNELMPSEIRQNSSEEDLFKDMGSLDDFEKELSQPETQAESQPEIQAESHPDIPSKPKKERKITEIPKFENPMEKSPLLKKLNDDQELFGDLDDE